MDRTLRCDCGFEVSAGGEDELVAGVRRHALEAHGMALSHQEALLIASRAGLDPAAPFAVPHDTASRTREEET